MIGKVGYTFVSKIMVWAVINTMGITVITLDKGWEG